MSLHLSHCHFNMRVQESKRRLINYFILFVVRKAFDFNFLFTNVKLTVRKMVSSLPAEQGSSEIHGASSPSHAHYDWD